MTIVTPCGGGTARDGPVHVEVSGRAVHLHRRAGLDRHLEQPVVVEVVAAAGARRPVGRVGDDVHERVPHGRHVALGQAGALVAAVVVKRGEDDVEAGKHLVGKIERAVVEDVHLDAVEHVDAGHLRAHRLDLGALLRHVVDRERARCPGALRVIGNREVRVAELARRLHHARGGVAPVAPRRMRVQVAPDVGERHQLRQAIAIDDVELVAVFAQLGGNVRQLEAGVDGVLGRRLDARTGAVQPAVAEVVASGPGAGAQRRGVLATAGVPQQRRARILRRREVERQRSLLGAECD